MIRWLVGGAVFLFLYGGCSTTASHEAMLAPAPRPVLSTDVHADPALASRPVHDACLACHDDFGEVAVAAI